MSAPKKVFSRARQASKQWLAKRKDNGPVIAPESNLPNSGASFLDLPPEIRNRIYEELVANTILVIPAKPRWKNRRLPGLLLACRQTNQELRSLWMTSVPIYAQVINLDFRILIIHLEKLPSDVRTAVRHKSLGVEMLIAHPPDREEWSTLIHWFDYCAARLPGQSINYKVQFGAKLKPPRPASRYVNATHMQKELLQTHIGALRQLVTAWRAISADITFPERMLVDLQSCASQLDDDMQHVTRHWRSLSLTERESAFATAARLASG